MKIKTKKGEFYLLAIFPDGKRASFKISHKNKNNVIFAKPSLLSEKEKRMVYEAWGEKNNFKPNKPKKIDKDSLTNAINAFYAGAVDFVYGTNGEVLLSRD